MLILIVAQNAFLCCNGKAVAKINFVKGSTFAASRINIHVQGPYTMLHHHQFTAPMYTILINLYRFCIYHAFYIILFSCNKKWRQTSAVWCFYYYILYIFFITIGTVFIVHHKQMNDIKAPIDNLTHNNCGK